MNILIADKHDQDGISALEAIGCRVTVDPSLGPDSLAAALDSTAAEILIVRSTKVPAGVIESAAGLKLIIRAGAGFDNIDIEAAGRSGTGVANCPGMNADAVAELAMGLLLACDRRICEQTAELAASRWNKQAFAKARGLKGSTLGIVGIGHIGRGVADRARAFGMNVSAWSRSLTSAAAEELGASFGGTSRAEALAMIGNCDSVSIHIAATPETKNFCDAEFFDAMQDGAIFINTARGSVVDEAALVAAVESKGLRAGLDVYQNQPAEKTADWAPPVAGVRGIVTTHHVGASTDQAQIAVGQEAARIVREFQESGKVLNCVNAEFLDTSSTTPVVRTPTRAGMK